MKCLGKGTWSQITKEGQHILGHRGNLLSGFGPRWGQLADGKVCSRHTKLSNNCRVEVEPQTAASPARESSHGTKKVG